ncbi:transmembrane emp24 domain-containing protein p24delta4-like [Raphanus sativus]|uniref:Transmembrane emp24 domain-containing protein p24delta4-like n=1 Tax=Raphanus sativus TaxID=3726 RepID=A0A9W3CI76_RAPSA|nr:transmembrane emp24 domain-containing protein p24delta4-like [Raphanus sativus]
MRAAFSGVSEKRWWCDGACDSCISDLRGGYRHGDTLAARVRKLHHYMEMFCTIAKTQRMVSFAFTTQESGTYLACFDPVGNSHGNKDISINLDWKTGIAAKGWDSIARKEKIEGVELELRKLEGAVEGIHDNLLYLKDREAEMRIVSEKTNSRVAWFSIMSLGICIVVSGLQILYLKQYFEKKKLI